MTDWLLKSEPQTYSIHDLERDGTTVWDGVRNYQARNFLRQMQPGDRVFFYHSNITTPAIVGLARVIRSNFADPTQFDPNSAYFDPKATPEAPRWNAVEVEFVKIFSQPLSLSRLKAQFEATELLLVRPGNRLSVMPVAEKVAREILKNSE
ncbi:EVE domain-containing protein [Oscillatoria sp. FACHB-1406]|uniref:EVE domain-containing protein n=1 Tax=Oscillatoria sp. FACHB-1406 TaxID=2692846 RepID=UPI0016875B45|nr:EVE domain-containing protein [Oscillatoria sp. FACHB-1406]MBD2578191.1 EVE domain-containing protein [Oscillatoria sp. FACHB-1406]